MISLVEKRCKTDRLIIGGILVISYVLRLFYTLYYPVLSRDSYTYINIIERTRVISNIDFQESVYPLFFFLYRLPGLLFNQGTVYAGRAINIVLGTLTVYFIIALSRQISSNRFIWVTSGLIASTYPNLVHYSSQIQRDCLYLFFCSILLLFAIKFILRNRVRYIAYLAFISGCCLLTRHESLELLPFIFLVLFFGNKKKKLSDFIMLAGLYLALVALNMLLLLLFLDPSHIYTKTLSSRFYNFLLTT